MGITRYPELTRDQRVAFEKMARQEVNALNELAVATPTPLISLKSNYGLSIYRDIQTVTNSGSISNDGTEFLVSTGTTASSTALLESAEKGRYQAGSIAIPGIGVRPGASPTGEQLWKAGYFDDTDGFGFGEDTDGPFLFTRASGSDTLVRQSSWNVDTLDGSGDASNPSGLTLDMSDGVVIRTPFLWYGYGEIRFDIVLRDPASNRSRRITVHRQNQTGITIDNPNLPVSAYVENGATASDLTLYIGGRQFFLDGQYNPSRRITCQSRLEVSGIGTSYVPLVTFRRKSTSNFGSVSLRIEGYDAFADGSAVVGVIVAGTLTGASYGAPTNISASETALEADISATAISGGELAFESLIAAAGRGNAVGSGTVDFSLDIPPGIEPITLAIRAVSGTVEGNATLRLREEW